MYVHIQSLMFVHVYACSVGATDAKFSGTWPCMYHLGTARVSVLLQTKVTALLFPAFLGKYKSVERLPDIIDHCTGNKYHSLSHQL
jgi:hypothetical protein